MLDLKALLTKILSRITPTIQSSGNSIGSWECHGLLIQLGNNTQSDSSAAMKTWNTTFSIPYKYTPVVFTQIVNTQGPSVFHVVVNNITKTGCQWLRSSSSSTAYDCTIHWVAIGFSNGGGYLTSKLYSICSHLERWWEHVRFKGFVGENIKHFSRIGDSKNLYCFWESLQHILRNNFNRRNANRIYANSNSKSFAKPSNSSLLSLASKWQHGNHRRIAPDFKWDDIFTLNYNRSSIYQGKLNSLILDRGCLAC